MSHIRSVARRRLTAWLVVPRHKLLLSVDYRTGVAPLRYDGPVLRPSPERESKTSGRRVRLRGVQRSVSSSRSVCWVSAVMPSPSAKYASIEPNVFLTSSIAPSR
jgi:hypothetical protein